MADDDKRSPKDKVEFADVIVIGAGVAGLNAARCLNQEGNLKVVVLEGRERIGGRILTWETEGVSVDMGASFIHGKMILTDTKKIVNPVYRYCEDESLPFTYGTRRNGYNFYGRDAPVLGKSPYEPGKSLSSWPKSNMLDAGEIQKNVKRYYQKVMSGLRKFQAAKKQDPTFDDISVWDALHQVIQEVGWPFPDSPCLERDFFDYLVWIREEFEGIPYSEMSLLDMDEEDDYLGGNTCLRGGYKSLISSLAKGLDIRLNCHVSDIVQADSNTSSGLMVGVQQGGKGEEEGDVQVLQWYKCKYCICTAPLGVLQHGDLTFKPPLPEETLQGISHLKMGLMDKVALFYHNRFWPDDIYRFVFVSEERRGLWPWLTPCDSLDPTANCGALLAWMACDYAEDAEKKFLSDEEMVDEVMKVVRRIFPGAPKPDSFCVTRWKSEPFSRGSWTSSPVRPVGGKSAAYWSKKMGLPMWGNRLFLAGEHVVDETMNCIGTVTSAFHIGEVQARRILEDSKKGKEEGEE